MESNLDDGISQTEAHTMLREETTVSLRWKRGIALGLTGLWLWFILARSAQPAEQSGAESAVFLDFLRLFFPSLTDLIVRKLAHFTEYFILGALLFADWRMIGRGRVLLPSGLGAAVAFVDELLVQTHTPGRSGELRDVLLDTVGVVTAVAFCLLLRRRKEKSAHGGSGKEA